MDNTVVNIDIMKSNFVPADRQMAVGATVQKVVGELVEVREFPTLTTPLVKGTTFQEGQTVVVLLTDAVTNDGRVVSPVKIGEKIAEYRVLTLEQAGLTAPPPKDLDLTKHLGLKKFVKLEEKNVYKPSTGSPFPKNLLKTDLVKFELYILLILKLLPQLVKVTIKVDGESSTFGDGFCCSRNNLLPLEGKTDSPSIVAYWRKISSFLKDKKDLVIQGEIDRFVDTGKKKAQQEKKEKVKGKKTPEEIAALKAASLASKDKKNDGKDYALGDKKGDDEKYAHVKMRVYRGYLGGKRLLHKELTQLCKDNNLDQVETIFYGTFRDYLSSIGIVVDNVRAEILKTCDEKDEQKFNLLLANTLYAKLKAHVDSLPYEGIVIEPDNSDPLFLRSLVPEMKEKATAIKVLSAPYELEHNRIRPHKLDEFKKKNNKDEKQNK